MLSVRVLHAQAPMKMFEEIMAITTRVAPSFIRIGHVDLHSRRCQPTTAAARVYPGTPAEAKAALRKLVCPSVPHLNMSLEVGKYHYRVSPTGGAHDRARVPRNPSEGWPSLL